MKKCATVLANKLGASSWLQCPTAGSMMQELAGSLLLTSAAALRGTTLHTACIHSYRCLKQHHACDGQRKSCRAPVSGACQNQGW